MEKLFISPFNNVMLPFDLNIQVMYIYIFFFTEISFNIINNKSKIYFCILLYYEKFINIVIDLIM